MKRKRLNEKPGTYKGFSVYRTTAENIRELAGHYGTVSRAIALAVEILYDKSRQTGAYFEPGMSSEEEEEKNLKVPLSFSVLPRTARLIDVMATEYHKSRNDIVAACEPVLAARFNTFYLNHMTPAEKEEVHDKARQVLATRQKKRKAV